MSFFTISPIFRQAPKLKLSKRIWIFIHYIWIVCTHKVKQLTTTEIVIDGKTYHCSNTKYCRKNHEFFYYKYEFDYVPVEQLWREYGNGRDFFCSPMYNYLKINNNDEFNHKERILDLQEKIKKNGFDESWPIIINQYNFVQDGAHRVSLLLYLFGPDYKVPCLRFYSRWSRPLYGVRYKRGYNRYYFLSFQIWKKKVDAE